MFPDYMKIFNMHKQSGQSVELHKGQAMFILILHRVQSYNA